MMWHYMLFGSADLTDTGESLIGYCRENRRVCPQPPLWNEFWQMLPNRHVGSGGAPAAVILAAWHTTPAHSKMLRREEHIQWAD